MVTGALGIQSRDRTDLAGVRAEMPLSGSLAPQHVEYRAPSIVATMFIAVAFPAALFLFGIGYIRYCRPRYAAMPRLTVDRQQ